jgi:hypothetical protein
MEKSAQNVQLAKLFAKLFIARPDVKAIQNEQGEYRPLRDNPFTMADLLDHIEGRKTYGHYMLNPAGHVKFFCFDVDLLPAAKPEQSPRPKRRIPSMRSPLGVYQGWREANPRDIWMSRQPGAARDFLKGQMNAMAGMLTYRIKKELDIPAFASYSGSKGVHVYGITGKTTAALARQGAQLVLESMKEDGKIGYWELSRGNNFYSYVRPGIVSDGGHAAQIDPDMNYEQFSLEVYPKQDNLDGKDLGNLLRLPLGVNLKSPKRDKGFFLDLKPPISQLRPVADPVELLTNFNPWQ